LKAVQKGEHLFAGVRGANSQAAIRKDVLKKNIAHFWENVKRENEKSSPKKEKYSNIIVLTKQPSHSPPQGFDSTVFSY